MPTLQVRGTSVSYYDARRDETGIYYRVHCESDVTRQVAEKFKWEIFKGDGEKVINGPKSIPLKGELIVTTFSLTPNGMDGKNVLEFEAESFTDFSVHEVKADEDTTINKLRFTIRTREKFASAKIDAFIDVCGEADGLLKLTYGKGEQGELPLGKTKTDDKQQTIPGTSGGNVTTMPEVKTGGRRKKSEEAVQ